MAVFFLLSAVCGFLPRSLHYGRDKPKGRAWRSLRSAEDKRERESGASGTSHPTILFVTDTPPRNGSGWEELASLREGGVEVYRDGRSLRKY